MLIISDNLNVRYSHVAEAVEKRDGGSIRELAHKATAAGADVIDISIGSLRTGADEIMAWLVDEVQQVSDLPLSLDAHTAEAIIAGAERAKRSPMLNSYSVQSANPDDVTATLVPYAADKGYEIILCTMDPSGPPLDPDIRGSKASELVEGGRCCGVSSESHLHRPGGRPSERRRDRPGARGVGARDHAAVGSRVRPADQDRRRCGVPVLGRSPRAAFAHQPGLPRDVVVAGSERRPSSM